jgi:hypothetical protein
VLVFYIASQAALGGSWVRQLRYLPALMGLGIGLSLNNARAVVAGLARRGGTFHRTPKYRIEQRGEAWRGKRYRVHRNVFVLLEALFALYLACCFVWAIRQQMWLSLPFLYLFLHGHCYIVALTLTSGWEGGRRRTRPALGVAGGV